MAGLRCSMPKSSSRQSKTFSNPNADSLTRNATEFLTKPYVVTNTTTVCDVASDATHNRNYRHYRGRFSKVRSDGLQYSRHDQGGKF
jgi:hypothetical protein